jgi:hypothetical protein
MSSMEAGADAQTLPQGKNSKPVTVDDLSAWVAGELTPKLRELAHRLDGLERQSQSGQAEAERVATDAVAQQVTPLHGRIAALEQLLAEVQQAHQEDAALLAEFQQAHQALEKRVDQSNLSSQHAPAQQTQAEPSPPAVPGQELSPSANTSSSGAGLNVEFPVSSPPPDPAPEPLVKP